MGKYVTVTESHINGKLCIIIFKQYFETSLIEYK